jgi:hypothetical protein
MQFNQIDEDDEDILPTDGGIQIFNSLRLDARAGEFSQDKGHDKKSPPHTGTS